MVVEGKGNDVREKCGLPENVACVWGVYEGVDESVDECMDAMDDKCGTGVGEFVGEWSCKSV